MQAVGDPSLRLCTTPTAAVEKYGYILVLTDYLEHFENILKIIKIRMNNGY
jgi:hypothetical protein